MDPIVFVEFNTFQDWLGLLGNIFAIIFFILPIFQMIKLHKKIEDPKNVAYLMMIMNVMNCFLWLSYGILKNDFWVMLANGIGYPTNMIYLCVFFFYYFDRNFFKSLIYILPSIILSGGLFAILTYAIVSEDLSKYSACVFNVFMYGAPGQKIVTK